MADIVGEKPPFPILSMQIYILNEKDFYLKQTKSG